MFAILSISLYFSIMFLSSIFLWRILSLQGLTTFARFSGVSSIVSLFVICSGWGFSRIGIVAFLAVLGISIIQVPGSIWKVIGNSLTWFGTESVPESRRPVYALMAVMWYISVVTVFSIHDYSPITHLFFMVLFAIFGVFMVMSFGQAVFDGVIKFSNDFRIIREDGKPMSALDSALSMIGEALNASLSLFKALRLKQFSTWHRQ